MNRLQWILPTIAVLVLASAGCNKSPTDQTLTTDIQAKLYGDAITKPANVNVAVKNGVVTLNGDLPSSDIALEAVKVAKSTPGVKRVDDQMTVNGAPAASAATVSQSSATQAAANQPPPAGVATPQPQGAGAYPALPSSTAPATQPSAPQTAQTPPSAEPSAAAPAQPAPPPEPVTVTVPAGEQVSVRTIDPIDSGKNTPGQVFRATLATALVSHRQVAIPAGAPALLLLTQAKSAGHIKGSSELEVQLTGIDYRGRKYKIASSVYEEQGKGRGKQTAVRTGIGAAAGAIIGGIAGGGRGAAIGSAAGGGAGFGVNVFTHGQR